MNKIVTTIINSILFGLITLFLIRLYVINDQFTRFINQLFNHVENFYTRIKTQNPGNIKKFLVFVCVISLIIALIPYVYGTNFFIAFAITALILIPGIPLYIDMVNYQQHIDFESLFESIKAGEISKSELYRLKQAIKEFYAKQYTPKFSRDNKPSFLGHLVNGVIFLIFPKAWPRVIIPRITAIPQFSSLFYYSPYHARFNEYKQIIDSIYDNIGSHPYRLQPKEILLYEAFMVFAFKDINKHAVNRLTSLARKLEKDHQFTKEAIMIQENDDGVKLFIPADILHEH